MSMEVKFEGIDGRLYIVTDVVYKASEGKSIGLEYFVTTTTCRIYFELLFPEEADYPVPNYVVEAPGTVGDPCPSSSATAYTRALELALQDKRVYIHSERFSGPR